MLLQATFTLHLDRLNQVQAMLIAASSSTPSRPTTTWQQQGSTLIMGPCYRQRKHRAAAAMPCQCLACHDDGDVGKLTDSLQSIKPAGDW